jgi:hypothetical protein
MEIRIIIGDNMSLSTETTIIFSLSTDEVKNLFTDKIQELIFKPMFPTWPTNGIIYDKNKKKLVGMVDFGKYEYLDFDDIRMNHLEKSQFQGDFERLKLHFTHGSWNRDVYRNGIVIPVCNFFLFPKEIDPKRFFPSWHISSYHRFTYKCCRMDRCKVIEKLAFEEG